MYYTVLSYKIPPPKSHLKKWKPRNLILTKGVARLEKKIRTTNSHEVPGEKCGRVPLRNFTKKMDFKGLRFIVFYTKCQDTVTSCRRKKTKNCSWLSFYITHARNVRNGSYADCLFNCFARFYWPYRLCYNLKV